MTNLINKLKVRIILLKKQLKLKLSFVFSLFYILRDKSAYLAKLLFFLYNYIIILDF